MLTQTAERQELQQVIDTISDDDVTAMLDFIRSLRRPREAPLDDDDDGFYNHANLRRLDHSIEQLNQGRVVVKTIEELERMVDE